MLGCFFGPNLVILVWTADELCGGQAQNEVKFDFQIKFDLEGQSRSSPKTIGTTSTNVFCTFVPNLVIPAWTSGELSCGQARDWYTHTDTRTHRHTDAGNDNTRRPKLASGNKTVLLRDTVHQTSPGESAAAGLATGQPHKHFLKSQSPRLRYSAAFLAPIKYSILCHTQERRTPTSKMKSSNGCYLIRYTLFNKLAISHCQGIVFYHTIQHIFAWQEETHPAQQRLWHLITHNKRHNLSYVNMINIPQSSGYSHGYANQYMV